MSLLNPEQLFSRIADDIPSNLHDNILVTGSLAAAYEFRDLLQNRAVNTKDADLIVQPAGSIEECRQMVNTLLSNGWRRTNRPNDLQPAQDATTAVEKLPVIRLYPLDSTDYFLEFLNLPAATQRELKEDLRIQLQDGWSILPSFRFMRVLAITPRRSKSGLRYASPSMLALANLLAHQTLGTQTMSGSEIRRSAKDLGRILAIAFLAGQADTKDWGEDWRKAIEDTFPSIRSELFRSLGSGLRELLDSTPDLKDASTLNAQGLLSGKNVSQEATNALGERLWHDVVLSLRQKA